MFAKQTVLSASLVALLGAAGHARAEGDVSPQSDDEVSPQSDDEVSPQRDDEVSPQSDDEVSPQRDDEVHPPGTVAPAQPPGTVAPAQPPDRSAAGAQPPPPDGPAWANSVGAAQEPLPEPRALPPTERFKRRYPGEPVGTFSIGAGFSSDEGFLATATIAQPDLFHTGNQLSLHARISQRRQLFLLRYADPEVWGTHLAYSADLYNDSRKLPGFTRDAVGGSLTLSYPIRDHLRAFVGYRLEDVKVTDTGDYLLRTTQPVPPPVTGGTLSALRAGWIFDTLDRRDAPLRGSNIGASIEVADRSLGSDLEYTKIEGWVRHHQPIGPLTLHLNASFTTITGPGSGSPPRSERLFLTSSNEIRGYSPLDFGPVDSLGHPIGGDVKLLGSAELEAPLVRRLGLSAIGFIDAGGLFDRNVTGQAAHSVGFGLLWRSPIGALRFSWAFPLDGGKPVFCFGIGAPF